MAPSNSMSKSLLVKVDSFDSDFKLPPKSFSQAPTLKRIWNHIATATSALIMIAIPVGVFVFVLFADGNALVNGQGVTYCIPFYMSYTDFYTILNIDTTFGTLSFGTAKLIDLVWDIGFSRCGQAMLAWITYRVNTSALLRIMEMRPVSYELFSTLSLSWSSVASLGPVIKAFFTKLGFRKKLILIWIMLNIFWVAFWPTITNAMTGYVAKYNTLVQLQGEDGYVNFTDISSASNLAFQFYTNISINGTWSSAPVGPILLNTGPNTTLWANLNEVVQARTYHNRSHFYDSIPVTNDENAQVFYYYRNQTYLNSYFVDGANVQCVATGVYQWGFSSFITFVFVVFNGLWFTGTYGVWIHMNRKSALCQKGRRLGKYRAAIDLVESINQDLGKDICAYSEQELKDELKKQGDIKYYVGQRDNDSLSHIGITSSNDRGLVRLRFGVPYGHL
ncbi:hypothetical protein BDZ45DRAFT_807059 [Acephala macrosclerotiorum]|nr:hypothetical protein BDZ45DRAFT_807059 [Acephala macrosclerotiorum]